MSRIALLAALWWSIPAVAEEPTDDPEVPAEEGEAPPELPEGDEPKKQRKTRWSGIVIPLASVNTVDGFGFGAGGEIYSRPREQEHGYKLKFTGGVYVTTRFDYTSDWLQVEYKGRIHWIARAGYRGWGNLAYAGVGGRDISVRWSPEEELGNALASPYGFIGGARKLPGSPVSVYAQVYLHGAIVRPAPGGLLDDREPFGARGGVYGDVSVGVELDQTDKWPLPNKGTRGEAGVRFGMTWAGKQGIAPLGGITLEVIRWQPLIGEHLVLGMRLVASKSVGYRPFFVQDVNGGRWRDELGSEQPFTGYGRTRTRGDGLVAGLVELRPYFGRIDHKIFDLAFYLSIFAEEGWLFDGADPGHHLPTLGAGPEVLFQGAIQLRPFVAFGWWSEDPGAARGPVLQYGISLMDPL